MGTLFLLLAVRELWRGQSEKAAILTTIAAIIKPQFGILIPLAAVVIIRRHWVERPDDGDRLGGGPTGSPPRRSPAWLTAVLVCLPFGLAIVPIPGLVALEDSLLGQILQTAGGYPYVTVNAYNPWALVTLDGNGLAAAGTWIRDVAQPRGPCGPVLHGVRDPGRGHWHGLSSSSRSRPSACCSGDATTTGAGSSSPLP